MWSDSQCKPVKNMVAHHRCDIDVGTASKGEPNLRNQKEFSLSAVRFLLGKNRDTEKNQKQQRGLSHSLPFFTM